MLMNSPRHATSRQVDEEKNEIARQSFAGPDLGGKEVCRYHQFPMMSQEFFPSCLSISVGRWFDAVPPKNSSDRAAGTFISEDLPGHLGSGGNPNRDSLRPC